MKKLTAILLALVLLVALGTTALAAGTGTITVNNIKDTTVLDVYQILTFDVNDEGNFSNVKFANPAYKAAFVDIIDDADIDEDSSVADIMLWITNNKATSSAFAKELAEELEKVINAASPAIAKADSTATGAAIVDGTWTTVELATGYYLILDVTEGEAGYEPVVIMKALDDDITVNFKSTDITIPDKTATGGWAYAIGDTVDYVVTVEIPSFGEDFATAKYYVQDTMGTGLAFGEISDVFVDMDGSGTNNTGDIALAVGTNYTQSAYVATGFTLSFEDASAGGLANYVGKDLVIKYTATVTADAVGSNGFTNEVGTNTGDDDFETTPYTVYTYGIDLYKDNEDEEALPGVGFKLYDAAPYIDDGDGEMIANPAAKVLEFNWDATNKQYVLDADGDYEELFTGGPDKVDGNLKIWGLDLGTYYLEETSPLPGYNALPDVLPIVLEEVVDGDGEVIQKGIIYNAEDVWDAPTVEFNDGYYDMFVTNTTGITLPGTGGIGTMLFTFFGGAIILSGCVLLFVNRKRVFGK